MSFEGAALGLALLLPLVLMRALGAGDWKLMGAVGAFLGPWPFFIVLISSTAISAFMAVVKMIEARRVKMTLINMVELVRGFFAFGFRPHPEISLDSPGLIKLPFGVAVAAATVLCFVLARLGV
jgi:prepilin peptidase CpaA